MLEGDEPYRNQEFFYFSFFNSSDLGFESKKVFYFCTFWLLFCPLDPGPHIFADPDPVSQNLAYPTDRNPKHCNKHYKL